MDERAIALIVAETRPRLEGAKIVEVAEGEGCLRLRLATSGGDRLHLVATVDKAMPLLFLSERAAAPCSGPPRRSLKELEGSTVTSVDRSGRAVRVATAHTHSAGRTTERALIIDLGRRPSIAVSDASPVTGAWGTDSSDTQGRPVVSSRTDRSGRVHVRITVGNGRIEEGGKAFDTMNDAASYAFSTFWTALDVERRRSGVVRTIARLAKRKERAVEKVRREVEEAARAEEYRHKGQLLLTRLGDVRRGVNPVRVLDYDNETEVEIEVDPKLGVTQNAEAFFRLARKAERKSEHAPGRLADLEAEARELAADAEAASRAGEAELGELEKTYAPQRGRPSRKAPPPARFRTYSVSGGWEVLVGKSNSDNDVLTHRIAAPNDLWFHARQAAGSHVVLRRAGRKAEPDRQAILEAASIAAYHSKAGKSSRVAVSYTEKRHVRKPRGAKPGLAIIKRERTVIVDPKLPER